MMNVIINNKTVTLPDGSTLADALAQIGAPERGIAVAVNGAVVPAADRAVMHLHSGDVVIIIKAFAGG